MRIFKCGDEVHRCNLESLQAGGSEKESDRGIFVCKCGLRWEESYADDDGIVLSNYTIIGRRYNNIQNY